jgi:hypothetical protein
MGNTNKKKEPRKKVEDKSKEPAPPVQGEDDYEDGDIATPKRDLNDTDDEPL